jgi:UDP-glucuronate decarboxylase
MLELAEKVLQIVGGHSKLVFQKLPADDPKQRKPDIALASSQLGWEPQVQLKEGLKRTVGYFAKLLKE